MKLIPPVIPVEGHNCVTFYELKLDGYQPTEGLPRGRALVEISRTKDKRIKVSQLTGNAHICPKLFLHCYTFGLRMLGITI